MPFEALIAKYRTQLLNDLAVEQQPVRVLDIRQVAKCTDNLDENHRLLVVLILIIIDFHRLSHGLGQDRYHLVLHRHLLDFLVRLRKALD